MKRALTLSGIPRTVSTLTALLFCATLLHLSASQSHAQSKHRRTLSSDSRTSAKQAQTDHLEAVSFEPRPAFRDGWGSFQRRITSEHRIPSEYKKSSFRFGFSGNDDIPSLSKTRLESAPEISSLAMSPNLFPPLAQDTPANEAGYAPGHSALLEDLYSFLSRGSARCVDLIVSSLESLADEVSGSYKPVGTQLARPGLRAMKSYENVSATSVAISPYDELREAIRKIAPDGDRHARRSW